MYRASELNRTRGHRPNVRKCPTQVKADGAGWLAEISNQIAAMFCVNSRVAAVYCWSALLGRFVLSGKGGSRMRFCLWWSMCWYFPYIFLVECVGVAVTWFALLIKLKISFRHLCAVMPNHTRISDWISTMSPLFVMVFGELAHLLHFQYSC